MRLISPVPRTAIDAGIRQARSPGHDPARWALPLLDALDGGDVEWWLVELGVEEYAALWLPAHAGEACHGDTMVLGQHDGSSVAEQCAWLETHASAYAAASPSCWGRIEQAQRSAPAAVVIASCSVGDRLKPDTAPLVIVDGYHRVVGYWRAGHRRLRAYLPAPRPFAAAPPPE